MGAVRLRQAVLVAAELEPVVGRAARRARARRAVRRPWRRASSGSTTRSSRSATPSSRSSRPRARATAAGRHLERHGGDGGYMVIFQLDDLEAARERVQRRSGVRVVWQVDLPDISGTHLHPADTRGAIVSLDRRRPARRVALGRARTGRQRSGAGRRARRDGRRARPRGGGRALGRGARAPTAASTGVRFASRRGRARPDARSPRAARAREPRGDRRRALHLHRGGLIHERGRAARRSPTAWRC